MTKMGRDSSGSASSVGRFRSSRRRCRGWLWPAGHSHPDVSARLELSIDRHPSPLFPDGALEARRDRQVSVDVSALRWHEPCLP